MTLKNDSNSESEAVDLARGRLNVEVGALVQKGESVYRVAALLDFESVIGTAVETGRSTLLLIRDLQLVRQSTLCALLYNWGVAFVRAWILKLINENAR
jgi:putative transposase